MFDRSDDSIFLELEWLHLLAADGPLPADCANVLRGSRMWRMVHPRPRRFPTEAVAIVAATALFPRPLLAVAPAQAATRMAEQQVNVTVVDAQTNRPIAGAQLVVAKTGERKGLTDAQGRTVVPLSMLEGPEVLVSKEGYRPFPLMTNQLRPGRSVYVGLARVPGSVPPEAVAHGPTARPAAATPKAHPMATPKVAAEPPRGTAEPAVVHPTPPPTAKPRPTPRLEVWPVKPKTTPKPIEAEPEPEPAAEEEPTPKPAVKPKKPAKPAPPKVAKKPGKKRMRTMKAHARPAPEPAGRYRVLPGDSLSLIASKKYGNSRLWGAIYASNRRQIDDPDLIFPGQLLKIPAERLARAAVGPKPGKTAVVHPGDSLWEIAGHYLGDPTQWRAIYHLNRGILDDPRLIHPGQVLRLPAV